MIHPPPLPLVLLVSLVECPTYIEDPFICDGAGEPKGQCYCGAKWYEHKLAALTGDDYTSAARIHSERGTAQ